MSFSLVAASGGYFLVEVCMLLIALASLVVSHRLSCPVACGTLVPGSGIELESPALAGGFLTTGPPQRS